MVYLHENFFPTFTKTAGKNPENVKYTLRLSVHAGNHVMASIQVYGPYGSSSICLLFLLGFFLLDAICMELYSIDSTGE